MLSSNKEIEQLIGSNNSNFAIRVEHLHYSTKDRNQATEVYHIEKEAKEGVRVIKELKNPNDTHKYNAKACIKELNRRIEREGINLLFHGEPVRMNQYHFQNFISYFGIKTNEKMCFVYQVPSQPQYSYSQQAIDYIFEEIRKAPERILDDLKEKLKRSTPGAKDSQP